MPSGKEKCKGLRGTIVAAHQFRKGYTFKHLRLIANLRLVANLPSSGHPSTFKTDPRSNHAMLRKTKNSN